MGRLIAMNDPENINRQEQLAAAGYRVEWDEQRGGNVCYDPHGEELFIYGTTDDRGEYWGAWAYLIHLIEEG